MKYLLTLIAAFLFGGLARAQNFPDSQKQPKPTEMHRNHTKYEKQGVRHHIHKHVPYGHTPGRSRTKAVRRKR